MARCVGTSGGQPCKAWAIKGGTVCVAHGGLAPQVIAAAQGRVLEQKARKLIPKHCEPMADPIGRLLELATEADEFRAAVAKLVNKLKKITSWSMETGYDVRAEVLVYERALDRVARLCVDIAKLNLGERLVQVRESEALLMLKALDHALAEQDLPAELVTSLKTSTARYLRAVS